MQELHENQPKQQELGEKKVKTLRQKLRELRSSWVLHYSYSAMGIEGVRVPILLSVLLCTKAKTLKEYEYRYSTPYYSVQKATHLRSTSTDLVDKNAGRIVVVFIERRSKTMENSPSYVQVIDILLHTSWHCRFTRFKQRNDAECDLQWTIWSW